MKEKIILLIEDRDTDVALTLAALKTGEINSKVFVVNDGEAALDYLFGQGKYAGLGQDRIPAVILLDLKLPKISGLEVLKQIRADERTKLLPVVILTSSKEKQDMIMGYSLGCNSYVYKPVDFQWFCDVLRNLELYWLKINKSPLREEGECE